MTDTNYVLSLRAHWVLQLIHRKTTNVEAFISASGAPYSFLSLKEENKKIQCSFCYFLYKKKKNILTT